MKVRIFLSFFLLAIFFLILQEQVIFADFESSLLNIKYKLTKVILPLISVIGLILATFSFITGNPSAKQHIVYAIVGSAIGFGAQSIIDFISFTVY